MDTVPGVRWGRLMVGALTVLAAVSPAEAADPPRTQFETTNGASWTSHADELAFLSALDAHPRVVLNRIGTSVQGRPLHLVALGDPQPRSVEEARRTPTLLFTCTQHGNEPAPREACLIAARDLAYAADPGLLRNVTILVLTTANPDGRQANSRENARGVDVNRDHIALVSPEGRAIAAVARDWQPDMALDLHEYGPSEPVLYDDNVLYLWPRNLNVDQAVHDTAKAFALDVLKPCVEAAGYTADEYGMQAVGDTDINQTAGDADEGILRNTMGLRHSVGILVESAVTPDPRNSPTELIDSAEVARRRVASQRAVIACTLDYVARSASALAALNGGAAARKQAEGLNRSAPVYFGGADNEEPPANQVVNPPPCAYDLTQQQATGLSTVLALHGIDAVPTATGARVPLAQRAEPIIPLLLDARAMRAVTNGRPVDRCAEVAPVTSQRGADAPTLPATGPGGHLLLGGLAAALAVLLRRASD